MSLTKDRLKQIIKEELSALLNEEVKSAKETLEDLGFRVDGDFEEGELENADREKDIDFLKLKDGRFRMTVREEAPDGGYDVSTHDHDSLDGLVQHIQQELGEDDLMEADSLSRKEKERIPRLVAHYVSNFGRPYTEEDIKKLADKWEEIRDETDDSVEDMLAKARTAGEKSKADREARQMQKQKAEKPWFLKPGATKGD